MIFRKLDKFISIFPYEEAVGHRLIALYRILNILAMDVYSRFHGSEKKVSTT